MSKQKVIMNHDGSIDDFMALAMLASNDDIELLGVIVTPADCMGDETCEGTYKMLHLMGKSQIPIALSVVSGINPFPYEYRYPCLCFNLLPVLNEKNLTLPEFRQDGTQFLVELLQQADEQVVMVCTGPLTTLRDAIKIDPNIQSKIKQIV